MSDIKVDDNFKEAFLTVLESVPNITAACKLMGAGVETVRRHRKKDEEWDARIVAAKEAGYDMLEEEARRRAVDGVVEPVFYRGEMVTDAQGSPAGIRKYSDSLLMFLLKGCKPRKFNPGAKVDLGSDGEKVTVTFNIGGD